MSNLLSLDFVASFSKDLLDLTFDKPNHEKYCICKRHQEMNEIMESIFGSFL